MGPDREVAAAAEGRPGRPARAPPGCDRGRTRPSPAGPARRSSSARHSTASAPCPTWGTICSTVSTSATRSLRPRRSSAARATTMAPPSGTLPRRVSTLPAQVVEDEVGPEHGELGPAADRHRWPPVPRAPDRRAWTRPARRGRRPAAARPPARGRPAAGSDGRSLAECTATSARPSSTACWTSFTNTPWPPMAWRGTSVRTSPVVSTTTSSTSRPGSAARRRSATCCACHRASALPRVARRRGGSRQVEQVAHGVGVALASRRAGVALQADRGLVHELGHDGPGERLDGGPLRDRRARPASRRSAGARPRGWSRRARAAGPRAAPPGGRRSPRRSGRPPRRRCGRPWPPRRRARPRPRAAQSRRSSRSSSVTPGSRATAASTSRGTATSTTSSGRPAVARSTIVRLDHDGFRAGGREQHVGVGEGVGQRRERTGPAAHPLGQLDGALVRAVHHHDLAQTGARQRGDDALTHLAGARRPAPGRRPASRSARSPSRRRRRTPRPSIGRWRSRYGPACPSRGHGGRAG